jgi:hypothetical protein
MTKKPFAQGGKPRQGTTLWIQAATTPQLSTGRGGLYSLSTFDFAAPGQLHTGSCLRQVRVNSRQTRFIHSSTAALLRPPIRNKTLGRRETARIFLPCTGRTNRAVAAPNSRPERAGKIFRTAHASAICRFNATPDTLQTSKTTSCTTIRPVFHAPLPRPQRLACTSRAVHPARSLR